MVYIRFAYESHWSSCVSARLNVRMVDALNGGGGHTSSRKAFCATRPSVFPHIDQLHVSSGIRACLILSTVLRLSQNLSLSSSTNGDESVKPTNAVRVAWIECADLYTHPVYVIISYFSYLNFVCLSSFRRRTQSLVSSFSVINLISQSMFPSTEIWRCLPRTCVLIRWFDSESWSTLFQGVCIYFI